MSIDSQRPQTLTVTSTHSPLMPGFAHAKGLNVDVFFDPSRLHSPDLSWFDPAASNHTPAPVSKGGRNAAWFVLIEGLAAVLRRYRRGGLAAKLSKDLYFWTGLQKTRAFAELHLLHRIYLQGFKVPRPLAIAVWRHGLFYRAAILTERIAGARPLSDCVNPVIWNRAGQTIRHMHQLGIYHADLNVYNILVDANDQIWIIDFDRCWQGSLSDKACHANLDRLKRSVVKVNENLLSDCYCALLIGYDPNLDAGAT